MTDQEILAVIKLTALETTREIGEKIDKMIRSHEEGCAAKHGVEALHSTVGYTTTAPEDTVHRRIQRVEMSLTKFVIFMAGSAGVGGFTGTLMDWIRG